MDISARVRRADLLRRRIGGEITTTSDANITTSQHTHSGHGLLRGLLRGKVANGVDVVEQVVASRSGDLTVRAYSPAGQVPRGCGVNLHGGGWVLGDLDLDGNDWTCSTVAARTGALVVSVDYRLAPAHRFPAGVQDCVDGLGWAAGRPAAEAGLIVMGDSAAGTWPRSWSRTHGPTKAPRWPSRY